MMAGHDAIETTYRTWNLYQLPNYLHSHLRIKRPVRKRMCQYCVAFLSISLSIIYNKISLMLRHDNCLRLARNA